LETVNKAERPYDQLPDLWLAALRNDATRFRERLQALGSDHQSLKDQVSVQRSILGDVLVDRLEVPDGPR
jgi:hypothetical protein